MCISSREGLVCAVLPQDGLDHPESGVASTGADGQREYLDLRVRDDFGIDNRVLQYKVDERQLLTVFLYIQPVNDHLNSHLKGGVDIVHPDTVIGNSQDLTVPAVCMFLAVAAPAQTKEGQSTGGQQYGQIPQEEDAAGSGEGCQGHVHIRDVHLVGGLYQRYVHFGNLYHRIDSGSLPLSEKFLGRV